MFTLCISTKIWHLEVSRDQSSPPQGTCYYFQVIMMYSFIYLFLFSILKNNGPLVIYHSEHDVVHLPIKLDKQCMWMLNRYSHVGNRQYTVAVIDVVSKYGFDKLIFLFTKLAQIQE